MAIKIIHKGADVYVHGKQIERVHLIPSITHHFHPFSCVFSVIPLNKSKIKSTKLIWPVWANELKVIAKASFPRFPFPAIDMSCPTRKYRFALGDAR